MKTFKSFVTEADKKDTVTVDIPLLIRILELAREDIKTDMDLHRVVERLIDIRDKGVLTMNDYNFIAHIKEEFEFVFEEEKQYTHKVVHNKTGNVVGKYTSLKAAHRAADKKDNAYGAIAHSVKEIPIKEDGEGGAMSAGPTNAISSGAIAGSGGKGGEPGVYNRKKFKTESDPRMMQMGRRTPPKA